ncbi:MAG: hypothetical protein HQL35_07150 [Alphaproteobacteria bacterium]|nr:hypothetical protein [Alphaproteobacteria bacterium]
MTILSFNSTFSNNVIAILDGVPSTELQTGRQLNENLLDAKQGKLVPEILYYRIDDGAELFTVLENIETLCIKQGVKPIIHIEAHGGKSCGIGVGDGQDIIDWSQLVEAFRKINVACGNNLGVVMAACHGLYAISPLHIAEPCPYYFLIGAEEVVLAGQIDAVMFPFYKKLHSTGRLNSAMDLLDDKFKQFHAEKFFCISFGKYLLNSCIGKKGRDRRERLITEYFSQSNVPRTTTNLAAIRRSIKKSMKSTQTSFYRLGRVFLHGRCNIPYSKLEKFVREGQRKRK